MIFDPFGNCREYPEILHPKEVQRFASSQNRREIPEAKIEILGRDLFVRAAEYLPKPANEKKFESHQVYADLQGAVKGREIMRCSSPASFTVQAVRRNMEKRKSKN